MNNTGTEPPPVDESVSLISVLIYAAVGTVSVGGLVFLTYFSAVVFDRYCCCMPWFIALQPHRDIHAVPEGEVAREARLIGLTPEERSSILKSLFEGEKYEANKMHNSESKGKCSVKEKSESKEERNSDEEEGDSTNMDGGLDNDVTQHEVTCAICIADYGSGDTVTRGLSCGHMFHKKCLLEWLDRHDVCPYCRVNMMSPIEYRNKATDVLGEPRVNYITMQYPNGLVVATNETEMSGDGRGSSDATLAEEADTTTPVGDIEASPGTQASE